MSEIKSKVRTRILFGAIMIAVLAGLMWVDWQLEQYILNDETPNIKANALLYALPTALILGVLLAMAFKEFGRITRSIGLRLLSYSGTIAAVAIATSVYWVKLIVIFTKANWLPKILGGNQALIFITTLAIFAEQMIRYRTEDALRRIAATLLAVIYLGLCGAFIFQIRGSYGMEYLIMFLATVKSTDIGAYFTGVAIGKHKMIPWLSPGKSWEGLAGGVISAAGVSILSRWLLGISTLTVFQAGVFGVVMALAGQFGDLCESLLKRSANIKDSGAAVPEFGGVLDIIDSPLIAAPIAIILLRVMV